MSTLQYVTELAFPEMMLMANRKTIRWNFIKTLEPPLVRFLLEKLFIQSSFKRWYKLGAPRWLPRTICLVNLQCECTLSRPLLFMTGLCLFDSDFCKLYSPRFGRLIHGSETIAKDVLEFVVFEKHLSNT